MYIEMATLTKISGFTVLKIEKLFKDERISS